MTGVCNNLGNPPGQKFNRRDIAPRLNRIWAAISSVCALIWFWESGKAPKASN
jgi:hypothetical protein